jgi:TfoX/Sxy family transcriptional regulator of competence genes
MAYNELTADRIYKILSKEKGELMEKKMFGGLCFMLNGNMVCGVKDTNLLLRVSPEMGEKIVTQSKASFMNHSGREMHGFVYVEDTHYSTDVELERLLNYSLELVRTLPPKKKK